MTFSFGQQKSTSTFGAASNTNTGGGLFGNTSTNTFGKSASTGGSLFGNTATTASTTNLFTNPSTANTGTSLFGNTTNTSNTGTTNLFSNTNTGGSLFGNSNNASGGLFSNTTAQSTGGLFGNASTNQNTNQQTVNQPHNHLLLTARALSQPQLFGDERDQILAKFNQILASWGNGKAYFSRNGDKVELSPSNHFCRFKTVGYACLPTAKNEDGLVWLIVKKSVGVGGLQKTQVTESLHQIFNKNPNIIIVIEGMRALADQRSEITVYVKEQKSDGTSRKLPASELSAGLNQQNVKTQLQTSIGLEEVIVRTSLTENQVKQILDSPPACIDPVIWKQAIAMNPDEKKMIPVPMLGFSALHQRLKLQEEMSKGHQNRSELLQREIRELQEKQANTKAKIEERKRNLLELSHRILEVTIHQEVQRKAGLAIQTEEEQLRAQLEALNNQLRAPTQFRGRLNELLSSIRMQGEIRPHITNGSVSLDDGAIQDVKNHLQKQQAGLNHMIERMKGAFGDLQTIENGLQETENRRI